MVSQTQAACYTSSSSNLPPDGRQSRTAPYYNRPPYPLYYPSPRSSSSVSAVAADSRRYTHLPPFSSHDSQGNHGVGHNTSHGGHHEAATIMADHHDRDATMPQRKRVPVACSRCRKRKIRCSGDQGDGLPCSNCKNAGVEKCRFLRVTSREAPIRLDMGDPFGYPVSDARLFHAGRGGPAPPSLLGSHQHDTLPYSSTLPEVAATTYGHRSGSLAGYSDGGATKPTSYYPMPPTTAYHSAYGDEYADYGMGVHSQSVMSPVEAGLQLLGQSNRTTA
ncbi:hypothetical protein QBC35DRAFT_178895 [Podospora australis]|uniref:Zn(2)-C6 fungal-type domain-containing protein n=1 Tax=Podospora australis TaxID=1536484 RepID=A0AAN6WIF0_9PEZI|nr:hypothetical protein QBC35DRAFT_178895 [Podospora australis]